MLSTAVRVGTNESGAVMIACSLTEWLLVVDGGFRPGVLDCTGLAGWIGHIQV